MTEQNETLDLILELVHMGLVLISSDPDGEMEFALSEAGHKWIEDNVDGDN